MSSPAVAAAPAPEQTMGKSMLMGVQEMEPEVQQGIDPSGELLHEDESLYLTWDRSLSRPVEAFQNHPMFLGRMVTPRMCADVPQLLVCSRLCQLSQSKVRYPVNSVAWARDGRRAITANQNGEFTLFNGTAFNFEGLIAAHTSAIRALDWSPSGATLLSGDTKGTIKYWESTMTPVNEIVETHGGQCIRDLKFAPTNAKFASGADDGTVRIWDWERAIEERVLAGHGWDVKALDWHSKYGLVASGSKDNQVKLWDPRKRTCLATLYGHKHTVMKVAWNPVNDHWLLTASRDQTLKLYDIRVLKNADTFKGHNREVTACAWHPVSQNLFVSGGYDGTVNHWLATNPNEPIHSHQAHEQAIWDMEYHPTGHVLATASNDHRAKFWARPRPGENYVFNAQVKDRLRRLAIERGIDPSALFDESAEQQQASTTTTSTAGQLAVGIQQQPYAPNSNNNHHNGPTAAFAPMPRQQGDPIFPKISTGSPGTAAPGDMRGIK